MSVVIDHGDSGKLAQPLEPAADPLKLAQRRRGRLERSSQCFDHAERRDRVSEVVQPRHRQPEGDRTPARPANPSLGAIVSLYDVADPKIGVGIETEPAHRRFHPQAHLLGAGIVRADNRDPGPAGELDEGVFQSGHGAVAFEVVGLDVVDHGHGGMQGQKRLIELVGFHHEQLVACHQRIAPPAAHSATGNAGGIEPGRGQRFSRHHRRGGLAVRPGDAHRVGALDQLGQRHLAGHDRQPQLPGPLQLRVGGRHRGGDDDGSGTGKMGRRRVPGTAPTPSARRSPAPDESTSHPLTATPRRQAMSASALIPAPPIPMKWTVRLSEGLNSAMFDGLM